MGYSHPPIPPSAIDKRTGKLKGNVPLLPKQTEKKREASANGFIRGVLFGWLISK